jgi:hypothetical protein
MRLTNERSAWTFKQYPIVVRACRAFAPGASAPRRGRPASRALCEHGVLATDFLTGDEAACAAMHVFDRDHRSSFNRAGRWKSISQRWTTNTTPWSRSNAVSVKPSCGQPFGARALHELEVVGVVDDPCGVGVL